MEVIFIQKAQCIITLDSFLDTKAIKRNRELIANTYQEIY